MFNTGNYLTILLSMGAMTVATIGLRRSIYQGLVKELEVAIPVKSPDVPVIIRDLSFVRGLPYFLGVVLLSQLIFLICAVAHEPVATSGVVQSDPCTMVNYAIQAGTIIFVLVFAWSVYWTAAHKHSFL